MRDIFNFFNLLDYQNRNLIDIWKNIDFSDEINSTDYQIYTFKESDNLMDVSYRFYNTIEDWWIIYVFNEMYDCNFDLINDNTISETIDDYISEISSYDSQIQSDKLKLQEIVRNFYNETNSLEQSIQLTNSLLSDPVQRSSSNFQDPFRNYLNMKIVEDSFIQRKVKIPSIDVSYKIKNKMEDLSAIWNS